MIFLNENLHQDVELYTLHLLGFSITYDKIAEIPPPKLLKTIILQ